MARISFVGGGGSGTPGGSDTQVQFNDSGAFSGSSGLVYDKATGTLTATNVVASSGFTGTLAGTASYATYAATAGSAASATTATSATTALTASYVLNAISASFASTAATATLFDGRSSTSFAGLTANTFTGVQTFTSAVTGTSAYFSGDVVINGTASIAMLETRNQQSLVVGDKYIVIMSGAVDHVGLDGAGLLFGSGSSAGTIDENGANAYVRYRNAYDRLEIFPGLRVSGSMNATGIITAPAISGSLTKLTDGSSYLIAGSNVSITTGSSGAITIAATGGANGAITATAFSGSLTKLSDGSSYLIAGSGVSITTGSNGAVTIATSGGEYVPAQFYVEGSVPLFTGTNRSYAYKACTITSLAISVGVAPTGSSINVRINKNGSSLVTGSLTAGSNYLKVTGLSAAVAEGDYLTLDVTQVGSTYPGYDLTVKTIAG